MDTPGPLARTVEDVAWLLQAIAGYDPKDPLSSRAPVPEYTRTLGDGVRGLRFGIIRELVFGPETEAEVRDAVVDAARRLERLGAVTEEVSLRLVPFAGAIFMALADADGAGVHHHWLRTRPRDYDQGTRRRLLTASLIPSAIQQRAARARALLRADMRAALAHFDLLLCPTAHQAAPPIAADRGAVTSRQEGAGQLDDERRAAFWTVDGPQRALVLLDDRVRDPEAESRAFAGSLRRGEGVEDSRKHVGMDAGPGVEHLEANVRPAGLGQPHDDLALALVTGHRLMRVLDEVEQHLLDLAFVGQHRTDVPEVGDDLDAVAAQLVALELEHPLDLILEATGVALGRVLAGEPQEVLEHLRRPRRFLDDGVQTLTALDGIVRAHEQELRLSEDCRQAVARLVRETRRQLADRRELLALDQLSLGRLEILELTPGRRVELRVLKRQTDLVRAGFDERALGFRERLARPAAERQGAEDLPAAVDRHAHEGVDAFLRDGRPRRRQEVGGLADVRPVERLAGGRHAADEPLPNRQDAVDLAQPGPQAPVAAQV